VSEAHLSVSIASFESLAGYELDSQGSHVIGRLSRSESNVARNESGLDSDDGLVSIGREEGEVVGVVLREREEVSGRLERTH
jgi:hypothetical protein